MSGDGAKVSVLVDVPPAEAFAMFTDEIDEWWRTGPAYRIAGKTRGTIAFADGRLFETVDGRTHEKGRVTVWDPPHRLSFEWRGTTFRPGEVTYVDVTFEPSGDGTFVVVHHHGFAALPPDHPVRHGQPPADFSATMARWWAGLATSLRLHAARAVPPTVKRS